MRRPPRGMILAAGFGSRLGTLGATRPKPMLPVCGAPLVRWSVEWLRVHGIREIAINLHHHGDQVRSALGDGSLLGVSITYFDEPEILGTGGGIRNARPVLDRGDGAPIVVVNGKLIHDIRLDALLEQHAASGAEATMVVRKDLEGIWGAGLSWNAASRGLTKFLDESSDVHDSLDLDVMFCGVHVLQPEFLDRIPKTGSPCIARTHYLGYFREHGSIKAHLH